MNGERFLEKRFPKKSLQLSNYVDGYYNHDGTFSAVSDLSSAAIKAWNFNIKFETDRVWGVGQALYFKGCPLVFGQDSSFVDVVFDINPNKHGEIQKDVLISERHFQLQPPQNNKIVLKDLESIYGLAIYSGDLKTRDNLHKNIQHLETELEVGDYVIVGQSSGFRVCRDRAGVIFLVKLTYKIKDSVFPDVNSDMLDIDFSREDESVLYAYNYLVKSVSCLKNISMDRNFGHSDVLLAYSDLFNNLFEFSEELGEKYFNGDWTIAVDKIYSLAIEELVKLQDLNHLKEAENTSALVILLNKFRTGELCDFGSS